MIFSTLLDKGVLLDYVEKMVDTLFSVLPRSQPDAKSLNNCFLVAHRGLHDNARGVIENTLYAFDRALKSGCKGIEFDVQVTADNVLVVHHDADLKRLWGQDKLIAQLTLVELQMLVPQIPTLAEVVAAYGTLMHLFIELKSPFTHFAALAETVNHLMPCQDYHLLTLDAAMFANQSRFPKKCLLLVAAFNVHAYCKLSIEQGYGGVLGNYLLMRTKYLHQLRHAGQMVGVGFVDSKFSLYRELGRGIQYIFTNNASNIVTMLPRQALAQ